MRTIILTVLLGLSLAVSPDLGLTKKQIVAKYGDGFEMEGTILKYANHNFVFDKKKCIYHVLFYYPEDLEYDYYEQIFIENEVYNYSDDDIYASKYIVFLDDISTIVMYRKENLFNKNKSYIILEFLKSEYKTQKDFYLENCY